MTTTNTTRDCRICGGDGWTDGSAELRRDGRVGDTTCIGCRGTGKELTPAPTRTLDQLDDETRARAEAVDPCREQSEWMHAPLRESDDPLPF